MPVFPVGKDSRAVNSPYAVQDYRAVNPEFGSLTDLRALVDAAHTRNMAVMLDWVANHTSFDNAWITAHPAWYKKDAAGAIASVSNNGNDLQRRGPARFQQRRDAGRNDFGHESRGCLRPTWTGFGRITPTLCPLISGSRPTQAVAESHRQAGNTYFRAGRSWEAARSYTEVPLQIAY